MEVRAVQTAPMAKFRAVDPSVLRRSPTPNPARVLDPATTQMVTVLRTITDASVAYEVSAEDGEAPSTLRGRLLRAARLAQIAIALRPTPNGWYVSLGSAPQRRSRTGRGSPPQRPAAKTPSSPSLVVNQRIWHGVHGAGRIIAIEDSMARSSFAEPVAELTVPLTELVSIKAHLGLARAKRAPARRRSRSAEWAETVGSTSIPHRRSGFVLQGGAPGLGKRG
jgi:hypothetical protein